MRVHLGSDHAGLELKDHLLELAHRPRPRAGRPRPVRLRRRWTTTRSSACARPRRWSPTRAAARQPRRGDRRLRQRRADRRQQGRGVRCRAGLVARRPRCSPASTTTPTSISVGGRMHTVEEMTRFVEVFLATPFSGEERHVRRIAHARRLRDRPASCRRCPSPPCGGGRRTMPEGHTLHRLAGELDAGVRRPSVRVSSPQGRFADSRGAARRRACSRAPRRGQAPVRRVRRRALRPRPPRPDRQVRRAPGVDEVPPPVGQVRLRLVADGRDPRRTPTCAAPSPATWSPREQRDAVVAQLGPGPAAPGRRPERAPGRGSGAAGRRSATC